MNYDRIILELIDRVSALENEVALLKEGNVNDEMQPKLQDLSAKSTIRKDTTRYLFRGHIYGKNRLVFAVVQEYVRENSGISANELLFAFDRKIQGSLGVVRKLEELKSSYPDYQRRFFASPNEIISTASDNCVVCSQWGTFNIDAFLKRASELGFEIKSI